MSCTNQTNNALKEQRRIGLSQHPTLTGIDFVEVIHEPDLYLKVYFVDKTVNNSQIIPPNITLENIQLSKSNGTHTSLKVTAIEYPLTNDPGNRLVLRLSGAEKIEAEGLTSHLLILVNVPDIDPYFDRITFLLQANAPATFDCDIDIIADNVVSKSPEIDYLAKDYLSFRQLMFDRLSVLLPNWQGAHAADLETTLLESIAYMADYLSYYQDAVATEAYLGTARRRTSVRRHARLLDYTVHEGCNARVWVQVQASEALTLDKGTTLLTHVPKIPLVQINENSDQYQEMLAAGTEVFETLYKINLYPSHNKIHFYTWGADEFSLAKGATKATFVTANVMDKLSLQIGDVVVFEQDPDLNETKPNEGLGQDADPHLRHAVRLTKVVYTEDSLGGQFLATPTNGAVNIVEIEWHSQDALPFIFPITANINGRQLNHIGVARANIVLADHGQRIFQETLDPIQVPEKDDYRPLIKHSHLTFAEPFYAALAVNQSAVLSVQQIPHLAQSAIELYHEQARWQVKSDLLSSDHLAQDFVVEIENNRQAYIRFGDGVFAKRPTPGIEFSVNYRVGNGSSGNVGAESIRHVVTDSTGILAVRNPLPAQGGTEPEAIEQVKRYAPQVFRQQQRAVTEQDYADVAMQYSEVKRAAASLHWTGSWHTVFIAVDRRDGLPLDVNFKQDLVAFINQFQLLGHDVEIVAPRFVALDIVLPVLVEKGYLPNAVKQSLAEQFSYRELSNGQLGFFHPENYTFAGSVYLSQVISSAVTVPGVAWIDIDSPKIRFQRWNQSSTVALQEGRIDIGKLEIAELQNNPVAPERGLIEFLMEEA